MRTYTYPALIEPGEESGLVVSFPDIPEAITQGSDLADALAQASDALGLALLVYAGEGRPLPEAGAAEVPRRAVTVAADVAAKLALLEAFRAAAISKSELGRRLGKDEKEVRRLLDPMHPTKLPGLQAALLVLGHRLVVGVERINEAA